MIGSAFGRKKAVRFILAVFPLTLLLFSCQNKTYNLVFISLDTTRYDFINTGRGARANTPNLRRFASQAVVLENAFATIPQTLPSHLSIFTARFPHECCVLSNENEYDGRHKMIQEVLREKGYFTAGIISLGTISGKSGISRGFDHFKDNLFASDAFYADGEQITRTAVSILDVISQKPFFLFAHYSDPHSPYAPPGVKSNFKILLNGKPVAIFNAYKGTLLRSEIPLDSGSHTLSFSIEKSLEDFKFFIIRRLKFSPNCRVTLHNLEFSREYYQGAHLLREQEGSVKIDCRGKGFLKIFQVIPILSKEAAVTYYTREVEYLDKQVGKLLKKLENKKLRKNTIVVVFADHGEGLGERDGYFGHIRYLNQQFIRVPLMIYLPGVLSRHIQTPVSLIGITPTILDFMGIQTADIPLTENWMPLIERKKSKWNKPVLTFAYQPSAVSDKLSVIKWPYQTIFNPSADIKPVREFYNLNISQSFSRFDQISKKVMIASSGKDYRYLVHSIKNNKNVFFKKYPLIMVNAAGIEKLKTLGYLN